MMYSAYTRVPEEFPTFEAAVDHLQTYPGSEDREPVAVLMLTETTSLGAEAEQVDGEPSEPGESQVYLVTVAHEVFGKKFTIEYIVEFGAIPEEEEDDTRVCGDEVECNRPNDPEVVDQGGGQIGEEPVEAPVDEQLTGHRDTHPGDYPEDPGSDTEYNPVE